ncbi:MAG TPA: DUF3102 domain-containing protein [Mycobacterium sp.]
MSLISNPLPILAAQINSKHEATGNAIKTGIGHALACGDALNEAKTLVPHGQWTGWLAKNTSLSERTAQRYMQISRECPMLESKTATVANLTIRGACELIAKSPAVLSEIDKAGCYVPADGHSLVGAVMNEGGANFIIINPSSLPDYYFVSHFWMSGETDRDDIPVDGKAMKKLGAA